MAIVQDVETLRRGDYIEASELYWKVLGIDTTKKQLTLTKTFARGEIPKGSLVVDNYTDDIAARDLPYWTIIRANSKEARGIEGKVKYKPVTKR